MNLDELFKIKFRNLKFLKGQQMLPKCCLNFSVDPRDAIDSLYDINRNRNTVFRGVLKPPVGGTKTSGFSAHVRITTDM